MPNVKRAIAVKQRRVAALVRNREDLDRARNDPSNCLAMLVGHSAGEAPTGDLIGMWINPHLAKQSPPS